MLNVRFSYFFFAIVVLFFALKILDTALTGALLITFELILFGVAFRYFSKIKYLKDAQVWVRTNKRFAIGWMFSVLVIAANSFYWSFQGKIAFSVATCASIFAAAMFAACLAIGVRLHDKFSRIWH